MISEAITDLSDISRSMSSELILNNGLIKALEFETAQLKKSGLYLIKFSVTGNSSFLDTHIELVLFRIVQEALNNIIKHSTATVITINLDYTNDLLTLDIVDNGRGFSFGKNCERGAGLNNMKQRANTLNGQLTINSQPGIGTEIKIEIPIHEQN